MRLAAALEMRPVAALEMRPVAELAWRGCVELAWRGDVEQEWRGDVEPESCGVAAMEWRRAVASAAPAGGSSRALPLGGKYGWWLPVVLAPPPECRSQ